MLWSLNPIHMNAKMSFARGIFPLDAKSHLTCNTSPMQSSLHPILYSEANRISPDNKAQSKSSRLTWYAMTIIHSKNTVPTTSNANAADQQLPVSISFRS